MPCTPQLHRYGHMPENIRTVEETDASKFASSVDFSSAELAKATVNRSIWRWALALFLSPVHVPATIPKVGERAVSIRSTEKRSEVRTTRSTGLARDVSTGTFLNRSPNVLFRDRKDQVTLIHIKGVGRPRR